MTNYLIFILTIHQFKYSVSENDTGLLCYIILPLV